MRWNWQREAWPSFSWEADALARFEAQFVRQSGILIGAIRHIDDEKERLVVDVITDEAVKTSAIEGEYLDRNSVQSSIRRNFGLETDNRRVSPAERGIADMMTDLYQRFDEPLTHATLYRWHGMLTMGRHDLKDVGCYRTHADPMRVVSGRFDRPTVHFEAPPSSSMPREMDAFLDWWRDTAPGGKTALPALTRAAIAHLYFVCVHPFEDGNGRIGRALAEKALAECQGAPTLIALSQTIERNRQAYYRALERNNTDVEVTDWLLYFGQTILDAQTYSLALIDFLIEKTKLYDRVRDKLNVRQKKVLERMFREGLEGFKGGLSAENYISITGTSRATATRDLQSLVRIGALIRTGALKGTRYHLNLNLRGRAD